ncbi:hypothetical protein [Azospirillum doebereinerae]
MIGSDRPSVNSTLKRAGYSSELSSSVSGKGVGPSIRPGIGPDRTVSSRHSVVVECRARQPRRARVL